MNHRLGTADSCARARVLLERARARATHPALAAWVARIDDLSARLSQ